MHACCPRGGACASEPPLHQPASLPPPAHSASLPHQILGQLDGLVKDWVRKASAAKGFVEPVLSEVRRRRPPPRALSPLLSHSRLPR